jgi:hypothetical protein
MGPVDNWRRREAWEGDGFLIFDLVFVLRPNFKKVLEIVCDSETRSKNLYVDWIVTLKYVPKVRTFVMEVMTVCMWFGKPPQNLYVGRISTHKYVPEVRMLVNTPMRTKNLFFDRRYRNHSAIRAQSDRNQPQSDRNQESNTNSYLLFNFLTGIHLRSCIWDHFGHKLPCRHHNFLTRRS